MNSMHIIVVAVVGGGVGRGWVVVRRDGGKVNGTTVVSVGLKGGVLGGGLGLSMGYRVA